MGRISPITGVEAIGAVDIPKGAPVGLLQVVALLQGLPLQHSRTEEPLAQDLNLQQTFQLVRFAEKEDIRLLTAGIDLIMPTHLRFLLMCKL